PAPHSSASVLPTSFGSRSTAPTTLIRSTPRLAHSSATFLPIGPNPTSTTRNGTGGASTVDFTAKVRCMAIDRPFSLDLADRTSQDEVPVYPDISLLASRSRPGASLSFEPKS